MIPLLLCSCLMWTLILDRVLYFYSLEKNDIKLEQLLPISRQKQIPESFDGMNAFLARNFQAYRTGDPMVDRGILDECALVIQAKLNHFLSIIAVLAAISPLFGLLGTVTGMISTFNVITLFGTGNAKAMAGGISEALITTQSGLMVAIPGLFMSVLLFKRSARLQNHLKETVMALKRSIR